MLARAIHQAMGGDIYPPDLAQYGKAIVFDPQDIKTLFQDAAGTTPVTGVEQQVGKMLDKGGGNYHATQSTAGSRPTLSARYNMLVGTNTLATQPVTTIATGYTLSFSGTGTVTLSGTATGALSAGVNTFTATAGTLTLTVSGTVTNAQLVASNQASLPYQSVTNSTTYDSDPSKFPWYLRFTDHWMVTPSIDATAYDKVMVACGLRKMSDAATGVFIEYSDNSTALYGTFAVFIPVSASTNDIRWRSRGTSTVQITIASIASPITCVLVNTSVIAYDFSKSRINGGLFAGVSENDQGEGTCGNYPIYIGKRAGTTLPFVGYFYGLTVLFPTALPNDNLIQAIERHYAAKAGIRL